MIEYPSLEILNEDQLVAQAISRVSGGLSTAIVDARIATWRELRNQVVAGLDTPICPELTNANPSSPHTVLLEAFGWLLAQQAYKFNQVPKQNLIAFANLFGIVQRPATAAVTTLRFTVSPPLNTAVTIPLGTQISTTDGKYVFQTTAAITIPYGTATGDATAERTVSGHTLLSPGVLTQAIDNIAYVSSVTNPNAVDSGLELESIDATLERVSRYQRRGERIVSTKDLEDAIFDEGLLGNGIVRAFPFIKNGEFGPNVVPLVGYTSVIVMTRTGDVIDTATRQRIALLLDTAVGNQFIYVVDPSYVAFNVTATIKLNTGSPETAVRAAVEANLRNFYAASREQFGRPILRSEIIAVIEGTAGVDRIVVADGQPIIALPTADTNLQEYQLPRLVTVTLTVV